MLQRLRTLWKLSGIEMDRPSQKTYVNSVLSKDGIKERLGIKKMITIVDMDEPTDIFEEHKETI